MFQNYIRIALRNLARQKGYSAINIIGLALGMACCILLSLSVKQEMSFDTFHENRDRIFRVFQRAQTPDGGTAFPAQPIALAPTMKAEIASVQYSSRFSGESPTAMKHNGNLFRESPVFVDADFFRMFSFQFLQGSTDASLKELQSVVLTKEVADKIFGENAQALGKEITIVIEGETKPFIISGVIANPPKTSSIELSVILRFENRPNYLENMKHWDNYSTEVYICLKNNVSATVVEQDLTPFTNTHFAEVIRDKKSNGIKPADDGNYIKQCLQPLGDVHFGSVFSKSGNAKGNVYILVTIAGFILLIASINFVNLSIARSFTRAREVGIRKTIGARRGQLMMQFLGEAMLVVLSAMILSIVLAEMLLPAFNTAMNIKLSLFIRNGNEIALVENAQFWGVLLTLFVGMGIAAGAYPALYVSGLQAASTLKSRTKGISPSRLRNLLVIVQFALAVGLIACTFVMREQTEFLQNKPLGYNRDYVMMIPTGDGVHGRAMMDKFKATLGANPNILSMSHATKPIGRGLDGSNSNSFSTWSFHGGEVGANIMGVGFDYIETLQIPMLAGRTFQKAYQNDTSVSVIVNELSARQIWNLLPEAERKRRTGATEFAPANVLGIEIPRSEPNVKPNDTSYEPPLYIVGVTANYHFESLRREIEPAMHLASPNFPASYIVVRIRAEHISSTVAAMENAWRIAAPDSPWIGSFLDDNITRLYRNQKRLTTLALSATGVTIALSCMGLFALAALIISQRTKEIGIRKVLGASVAGIIGLLTKDFLKLVGIAIIIALPIAWYLMSAWLKDYAYQIELRSLSGFVMFFGAGTLAVVIAFLTVAFQATRAARSNPVDALRSE
jgi:putative ABC transport system permease protein